MEQYVTIVEQRDLQSRPYTDLQGQPSVFHSRGFVLSNGLDEFYAEMIGNAALTCPEYDRSVLHRLQATLRTRRFTRTEWNGLRIWFTSTNWCDSGGNCTF